MIDEKHVYVLIGNRIKELRDKKFSQEELAKAIGVSRASIANYESGKQAIYISDLYKIADVLEVDIASLLPSIDQIRLQSAEEKLEEVTNIGETARKELEDFIKNTQGGDAS